MKTTRNKAVFTEYSHAEKGQHLIAVSQILNGIWFRIGRIYREYDPETKKYKYMATDFAGNQVFADIKDLQELKKQFVKHGESLAQSIPAQINKANMPGKSIVPQRTDRENVLKNIRGKNTVKDNAKVNPLINLKAKPNVNQIEKEQDAKNKVENKDLEQGNEENTQDKNDLRAPDSTIEEQIQTEPSDNELMERETELNEIREQNNDIEEEIER
jgi:hypothetical protein